MSSLVETFTPPNTPPPIGPYSHIAKAGNLVFISGLAGMDSATGRLVGSDVTSQTKQILELFKSMLEFVGSNLDHVLHVNVFLKDMRDFEEMNQEYSQHMDSHFPARTVIVVNDLPKPGARLTMSLTAVTSSV